MKAIIKYSKTGKMKFISHLDMVRLFSRVFFRSMYRIRYTEGFNPHPKMNFAFPISLGLESTGEYMEAEFSDDYSLEQMKSDINKMLPDGIEISDVFVSKTQKSLTAEIKNVIYKISLTGQKNIDLSKLQEKTDKFKEHNYVVKREKMKKNKITFKEMHINEYINSINILDSDNMKVVLEVYVKYDNSGTLKVEEITRFLHEKIIEYTSAEVVRKDIEFY